MILALAAAGSEYRGCESVDPPDGGARLPESTGGCLVDSDCVSDDMCVALVCRSGICVASGVAIDEDGDSYAPAPCGMDCDDTNPDIRPETAEQCDGVDEDCDGVVDEGAAGVRTLSAPAEVVGAKIVGMGSDYAVLGLMPGRDPANTLAAYVIGADGSASTPEPVGTDLAPPAFDVARDGDGLAVALITGVDAAPARLSLVRIGDTWSAAGPPERIGADADLGAARIATRVVGGEQWVVFDVRGGSGELTRRAWRSADPGTVIDLGAVADEAAGPDIADDGARVWVSHGERTLSAFEGVGDPVATQELPGSFGHRPLASGDGFVYAVYRDAFDHAMTRVTTASFTSPITAPSGNATDRVSIFWTGADVLVTRVDDFGVGGWLLEDDLRAYRATFDASELGSPGIGPSRISAATTDGGVTGVLSSHSDGVTPAGLAVLSCESP